MTFYHNFGHPSGDAIDRAWHEWATPIGNSMFRDMPSSASELRAAMEKAEASIGANDNRVDCAVMTIGTLARLREVALSSQSPAGMPPHYFGIQIYTEETEADCIAKCLELKALGQKAVFLSCNGDISCQG